MSDPADLTLMELLPLLSARALSARELVEACLARVEAHESEVQAFTTLTPELAQQAAERADAARAAGEAVGALAGIPVAVKDLFLTAGVPTTASSRVLVGYDPGIDSEVWARLRDAGAGLLGKTVLHEFAYGTGSVPTRNPWDLSRTPGGSSGGSGAALAARMAPMATGSDTGGSLRIPAAACGVSSLRPTQGRVSTYGVLPLARSFDTTGPMARRMLDVSLLLRLLAGHDPRDPGSLDAPVPGYPTSVREDLSAVRIGIVPELWDGADADLTRLCEQGLAILVDRGAALVEVHAPAGLEQVKASPGTYDQTMDPEALAVHREWLAQDETRYGADVLARLKSGEAVTAEQYSAAQQHRRAWAQAWRRLWVNERLDAVAHPTLLEPPAVLPARGPSIWPSKVWSVSGFPALSVPVGVDLRGLPVGLSLAALPEQEAALVGLGIVVDEQVGLWRRNPFALD